MPFKLDRRQATGTVESKLDEVSAHLLALFTLGNGLGAAEQNADKYYPCAHRRYLPGSRVTVTVTVDQRAPCAPRSFLRESIAFLQVACSRASTGVYVSVYTPDQ